MTEQQIDRDWDRLDALVDEDPIALRDAARRLTTALAAAEAELDAWMTRAYEAEGKLWKAEARVKAVEDVCDDYSHTAIWGDRERIATSDIRRALDG